jgi:catechol O-methyltransferase/protein arginine N-methyltransferase 5
VYKPVHNAVPSLSCRYKIGPEKGTLLEQQLQQHGHISTALEIGTFLGYSAIRTARHLAPGGQLVCIEANPDNAAVARQLLDYAGVGGSVTILQGLGSQQLPAAAQLLSKARGNLSTDGGSSSTATNPSNSSSSSSSSSSGGGGGVTTPALADFLFLDHCKDCYLPDLQQAEQLGVVGPGTLIMADNVLYPGAPGFLEYLDSSGRYQTQLLRAKYEYEQLWNPEWEPGKEDALSASVAVGSWEQVQ